jgi:hypothetical protein
VVSIRPVLRDPFPCAVEKFHGFVVHLIRLPDSLQQRIGAFFLDVAQAVDAPFADEQYRQADDS